MLFGSPLQIFVEEVRVVFPEISCVACSRARKFFGARV